MSTSRFDARLTEVEVEQWLKTLEWFLISYCCSDACISPPTKRNIKAVFRGVRCSHQCTIIVEENSCCYKPIGKTYTFFKHKFQQKIDITNRKINVTR